MLKRLIIIAAVFTVIGCSETEPQTINVDELATEAGLSENDYSVQENGLISVNSDANATLNVNDILTAFKKAGLPIGKITIQTAETDPNHKLGRPGEYIESAQFEDSRVKQMEPVAELEEPDLPLGGTIEVFNNAKDLQSRKKYIEQVYDMMPTAKEYMYVNDLSLLRLSFELTPAQAQEYENIFQSL